MEGRESCPQSGETGESLTEGNTGQKICNDKFVDQNLHGNGVPPPEKQYLQLLAIVYLNAWMIADALNTYRQAGMVPPKSDLIQCGLAAMYDCQYKTAIEMFEAAGARNELIVCGDAALTLHQPDIAARAYEAAGVHVPVDKFIRCGDKALADRNIHEAIEAYAAAGARDKLISCGDAAFEMGLVALALDTYKAAGARIPVDKLITANETLRRL